MRHTEVAYIWFPPVWHEKKTHVHPHGGRPHSVRDIIPTDRSHHGSSHEREAARHVITAASPDNTTCNAEPHRNAPTHTKPSVNNVRHPRDTGVIVHTPICRRTGEKQDIMRPQVSVSSINTWCRQLRKYNLVSHRAGGPRKRLSIDTSTMNIRRSARKPYGEQGKAPI